MHTRKPSVDIALAFLALLPPLALSSTPPLSAEPLPLSTCPATPPTAHLTLAPEPYPNTTNITYDNTTQGGCTAFTPGPTLHLDPTLTATKPQSDSPTNPDAKYNNNNNDNNNEKNRQEILPTRLVALLAVYGIDLDLEIGSGSGGAVALEKWIKSDPEGILLHHDMLFVYFLMLMMVYLDVQAGRELGEIAERRWGGGGGGGGGHARGGEDEDDEDGEWGRWHQNIFGVDLWHLFGVDEDEIPGLGGWDGGHGAGMWVDQNGRFPVGGPVDWETLFLSGWPWFGLLWHIWLVCLTVSDGGEPSDSEVLRLALHAGQCSALLSDDGMPEWLQYTAGYVHLFELTRTFYDSVAAGGSRPDLAELLVPTLDFGVGVRRLVFVDVRNLWVSWRHRRRNGV